MFYGPGAGELPTATSVVADLVAVVKNMKLGINGRGVVAPYKEKKLKDDSKKISKYFIRLIVADKRGVLAKITQLFADNDISFDQVLQQSYDGKQAEITLITHLAAKNKMENVVQLLKDMEVIHELISCYRVEGGDMV